MDFDWNGAGLLEILDARGDPLKAYKLTVNYALKSVGGVEGGAVYQLVCIGRFKINLSLECAPPLRIIVFINLCIEKFDYVGAYGEGDFNDRY